MPPKKGSRKKTVKAPAKILKPQTPESERQEPEQDVLMEPPLAESQTEAATALESVGEAVHHVVEAAGEFVENMNGVESASKEEAESRLTMEERKAKMEQLRAKMVQLPPIL